MFGSIPPMPGCAPGMPPAASRQGATGQSAVPAKAGNVNPNGGLLPLPCMKIGGLGELAKNDVALLNVCGSADFLLQRHTLPIENRYQQLGGRITVMIKDFTVHPVDRALRQRRRDRRRKVRGLERAIDHRGMHG